MFQNVLGNRPLKAYLEKALAENRLPQTLLFSGPDGIGKYLFAKELAFSLLGGNSPDLHELAPEGKSGLYAIDTLREMIDKEHAAPFQSPGKVFILKDVDRMQPAAANAMLKTLEEPTADTTFILLSSAEHEILPTILSRCTILQFLPLSLGEIEQLLEAKAHSTHWAKLSQGSAGQAFEMAEHPELEEHRKLLFSILEEGPTYPQLMKKLEKIEAFVEEGSDEDPVRSVKRVEHLFRYILMWHRDQHVRSVGGADLLFPDSAKREPVSLVDVEKRIEKARDAYARNMKLSTCLISLMGR